MIKVYGGKFNDYLISPKIRQSLLHWGHALSEEDFFTNSTNYLLCNFFLVWNMSYYQFNKKEILQKAKDKYCKEKASEYNLRNKEELKEKSKDRYKNLPDEKKK